MKVFVVSLSSEKVSMSKFLDDFFLRNIQNFQNTFPKTPWTSYFCRFKFTYIVFSLTSITYSQRVKKKASSYITFINIIYAPLIKFFCYDLRKHRLMTTIDLFVITTLITNLPAAGIISIYRFLNKPFTKLPIN